MVDRLTQLVANDVVSSRDLQRAIKDAKRRRDVYEQTGGRDGVETLWKYLGYWAKCRYEEAGREWKATSSALEPCPFKNSPASIVDEEKTRTNES